MARIKDIIKPQKVRNEMKTKTEFSSLIFVFVLLLSLSLPNLALGGEKNIREYIDLFRSDLSTTKVETIRQVMKLNPEESQVFWPIYREYESELFRLMDMRLDLIVQFVTDHMNGTFTNARAVDTATKFFKLKEGRIALWKKYYGKFDKALSPIRAAQFVQIEHQIALLIDLQIASEMPVIGQ